MNTLYSIRYWQSKLVFNYNEKRHKHKTVVAYLLRKKTINKRQFEYCQIFFRLVALDKYFEQCVVDIKKWMVLF